MENKNIYTTIWKSSSFIFWSCVRDRHDCFLKAIPLINNRRLQKTEGLRVRGSGTGVRILTDARAGLANK